MCILSNKIVDLSMNLVVSLSRGDIDWGINYARGRLSHELRRMKVRRRGGGGGDILGLGVASWVLRRGICMYWVRERMWRYRR